MGKRKQKIKWGSVDGLQWSQGEQVWRLKNARFLFCSDMEFVCVSLFPADGNGGFKFIYLLCVGEIVELKVKYGAKCTLTDWLYM